MGRHGARRCHRAMEQTADILEIVAQSPAVQSLARRLENGVVLSCAGVDVGAQPLLAAALRRCLPLRPIVFVTDGPKAQEAAQQDLETWLGEETRPLFYPGWEVLPHEGRLPHADVISERLEALMALLGMRKGEVPVLTVTAAALMQRTLPPADLKRRTRWLRLGDRMEPLDLIEWLEDQGYEPEAQVTRRGEIALRGGIVDFFPFTTPWPIRCEFFGDELESLREFNPLTQISREPVQEAVLSPGGELGLLKQFEEPGAMLVDYLPADTVFLLAQAESVEDAAAEFVNQLPPGDPFHVEWDVLRAEITDRGSVQLALSELGDFDGDNSVLEITSLEAFRPLAARLPDHQLAEAQRREFFAQLHRWARQGYMVRVLCNNDGERQRFLEVWCEYDFGEPEETLRAEIGTIGRGFLFEGAKLVVVTDAEIFARYKVQRPRRLKSRHAHAMKSAFDINFTELEEGDYVVHVQHGIGRYLGLKVMPLIVKGSENSSGEECIVIEYAPGDPENPPPRLYVPVSEAHLVSKYVGAGKASPSLNTLGGKRWEKAKARAERAVRDLAAEMLAIQATRESQEGYAFGADTTWQREFEAAFLYEETPDQDETIATTKADMESSRPMDRLVCGDVGFGKTEVAVRAAFKAVMGGRQVAVLVPTTVLAQQHFNTFIERMADYPVRVELLSRFRSRRQQQQVVKDLASGSVDIVIGTHRLVQPDVNFKNLGLVVIDEEQRFGVLHKERFKQLRQMVDVLTLSATPIPRTLYLALTGARDMSTIETPPQDRLPVETIVAQYDERIIKRAIQRELRRGGQVFFLHNRVGTIYTVEKKLNALLPEARILVGHGQMKSDELEEVMTCFVNGEADVLLSTTIIESGIDIPNANTIIIDRADRFGLSDLYQLRGRVGRYKHQAYAYILLPRHAALLADARRRISAIKQYSSLGSGFKIAMRDLEIRGAGNLLGSEQSGHITAVGFELYCQLLKQSVAALKGEKVKPRVEVEVRFDFLATSPEQIEDAATPKKRLNRQPRADVSVPRDEDAWEYFEETVPQIEESENTCPVAPAFLPLDYIGDSRQRIDIYRRLAQVTTCVALDELTSELRDRFGKLPKAVELLMLVAELKIIASEKLINHMETENDALKLMRNNDYITLGGRFPRLVKKNAATRLREIKKMLSAL